MSQMPQDLLIDEKGHFGLITLNRPQALHALTLPMIKTFQRQLEMWKVDPNVHAVIVQATPSRAFCAGGDVRWLYETGKTNIEEVRQFFWHEYRLNHYIHHFGKPYIVFMDGLTMGGGVGISLHGSHPIASEKFVFAMPETGIGFFPDIGASHLLTPCSDHVGTYLALTGHHIDAMDAEASGLIKKLIPSTSFPEAYHALLDLDLSKKPFEKVDACLTSFNWTLLNVKSSSVLDPAIATCFSADTMEGIIKNLEAHDTTWALETLNTLKKKSPLSLKVTLTQLQKATGCTLADCLRMDFYLANHFMDGHDFYEGIRALLVDKDRLPRWEPPTLSQVTHSMVDFYFQPIFQALDLMNVS